MRLKNITRPITVRRRDNVRSSGPSFTTRAPEWTGTTCSAAGDGVGPRSVWGTPPWPCWPAAGAVAAAGAAAATAAGGGAVAGGDARSRWTTRDDGDGRGDAGGRARARDRRGVAWPGCVRCNCCCRLRRRRHRLRVSAAVAAVGRRTSRPMCRNTVSRPLPARARPLAAASSAPANRPGETLHIQSTIID